MLAGLVLAVLRAALVFAAFAAYMMVGPGEFEAESVLELEMAGRRPNAPEVAVVASEIGALLTSDSAGASLRVELGDAESIRIIARETDPERARTTSRAAARRAVTATLGTKDVGETERVRAEETLAAYVREHPEVGEVRSPPPPGRPLPQIGNEARLKLERARVLASLNEVDADSEDNPYRDVDPAALKRRLIEIDAQLAAATSLPPAPSAPKPATELVQKIEAVVQAPRRNPVGGGVTLRIVDDASKPAQRVTPDRTLFLTFGALVALGAAFLPVRRRKPSTLGDLELDEEISPAPATPRQAIAPRPAPVPSNLLPAATATPASAPPESREESPVLAYPATWKHDRTLALPALDALARELLTLAETDCCVVAVSALAAGRAKADLAAALCLSLSANDTARILAIEADLSEPNLYRSLVLDIPPRVDFGKQLKDRFAGTADAHWYVLACAPSLHVLAATQGTPDLILSTHFESCVKTLRGFYDVIVIHAPSMTDPIPCRAVDDVVDGVVFATTAEGKGVAITGYSARRYPIVLPSNWRGG